MRTEQPADRPADQEYTGRQRYHGAVDRQSQKRTQNEHNDGNHNDLDNVQNKCHQIVREKVGKLGDIIRYPYNDLPCGPIVKIIKRQHLQFVKYVMTDIRYDPVPHTAHLPLLKKGYPDLRRPRKHETADRHGKLPVIVREIRDHRIHDVLQQQRRYQRRRDRYEHEQQNKDKHAPVRHGIAEQPFKIF